MSVAVAPPPEVTMSAPAPVPAAPVEVFHAKRPGYGVMFWVCTAWVGLMVLCAIVGKRLPFAHKPADYITAAYINDGKWTKVFSWKHPLGTSQNGDDWLSAAVVGSRNSMIIAFATVVFGFVLGGGLGMVAGFMRGRVDTVLTFIATVLLSFPPLLFIILLLSLLSAGPNAAGISEGLNASVWKLSLSLGILSIPTLYRVVRASTMQFADREFVLAARAMGATRGRILLREILPNVVKPMMAYGLVAAGSVMVIEASLSYLGVGVGDTWAWGKMIATGQGLSMLNRGPNVAFIPIIILFLTVMSFNFLGDKMRERLETKQGGI